MDGADPRYLDAKRTVDARARDRRVRDRLLAELPAEPTVVEAGAGTGVTVDLLAEWGVDGGRYRGVDRSPEVLATARERLRGAEGVTETDEGFRVGERDVRFERGDALTALPGADADLLVAQAFLDLVPLSEAFDAAAAALAPGGLLYAPITFDGGTYFQPDHPDDEAITAAYHDHIDAQPGRDARAGRHAIDALHRRPGTLLAVGASDWVVRPHSGEYPADERFFLETILGFVESAVGDHPAAAEWLRTRRAQLSAGELTYVAHQCDLLYRVPE
jgi:SAM-dependent methyltransferase